MDRLLAVLAALAVLALYLGACRIWPFTACGRCGGDGKLRSPSGRAWRQCRRCKGKGGRLRLGRRVLNAMSENARNATR